MGLWQTIVAHLTDSDDEVVMHACWVCGTAVQVSTDREGRYTRRGISPLTKSIALSTSCTSCVHRITPNRNRLCVLQFLEQ